MVSGVYQRLMMDNYRKCKTATSFTDRATAEAITSKAIDANQSKINNDLFGNQKAI